MKHQIPQFSEQARTLTMGQMIVMQSPCWLLGDNVSILGKRLLYERRRTRRCNSRLTK